LDLWSLIKRKGLQFMGLSDKIKDQQPQKEVVEKKVEPVKVTTDKKVVNNDTLIDLTKDELEFLIRLVGDSNFKGNNLMFIYDLVKKLQNNYVIKSTESK
tara:strand:+ start:665 stop:964 length:300 start_codon:yes stop_codon:yes gene_type:complete